MGNLLINIIELSIPVSLLIAALLAVSPFLKRAYVSKWRYFMWLFIAVRLLMPFRVNYASPITMELPAEISETTGVITQQAQSASAVLTPLNMLTLIWLGGIAVLVVYRVLCYFSFKRMVGRWKRAITDEGVLNDFRIAKDFAGVKSGIQIVRCKAVSTPMVFGLIRPVLLMPDMDFTHEELMIVLKHELVHLKRHDILYKLIMMTVSTVYWFNPVMHIMVKAADKDLELACDAEVVRAESSEYRRRYCETIMRLVHNRRGAGTALSTCFFLSKKTVMERFKYILDEKIKRNGIAMFCVVALSCALSGGAVSFAAERVAEGLEENLQILEREPEPPRPSEAPGEQPEQAAPEIAARALSDYDRGESVYQAYEAPVYEYTPEENTVSEEQTETDVTMDDETSISSSSADDIYDGLTSPDSVSSDGSREIYTLPDGNTAILQYDGDVLDSGYILVN